MAITLDGSLGITTPGATISGTDAILLPKGTTAQQPTGVAGYLRFNTTTTQFEGYNGSAWSLIGVPSVMTISSVGATLYLNSTFGGF